MKKRKTKRKTKRKAKVRPPMSADGWHLEWEQNKSGDFIIVKVKVKPGKKAKRGRGT